MKDMYERNYGRLFYDEKDHLVKDTETKEVFYGIDLLSNDGDPLYWYKPSEEELRHLRYFTTRVIKKSEELVQTRYFSSRIVKVPEGIKTEYGEPIMYIRNNHLYFNKDMITLVENYIRLNHRTKCKYLSTCKKIVDIYRELK